MGEFNELSGAYDEKKFLHRHALWILFVHSFLYAISAGVLMSTTSVWFLHRECDIRGISGDVCNKDAAAQAVAANRVSQYSLAKLVPNLLSVSFVGFWSDKYGRKPLLVLPTIAETIAKVVGFVAMFLLPGWEGWWFVLASAAVAGLSGGMFGALAVTFSGVVDCAANKPLAFRTIACGRAEGFMFLGLLAGPFGGAWLCDVIGLQYCLAIAAVFNVMDTFMLFFLPETLHWSAKEPVKTSCVKECAQENPLVSLAMFLTTKTSLRICGLVCFSFTQSVGLATVMPLYLTHEFSWSNSEIGGFQSFQYGINAVGLVVILPFLQKYLSIKQVILLSLMAMPVVFVLYSLVPSEYSHPLMFSIAGVGMLNALYFPGVRVVVSAVLGYDKQGRDQRGKAFAAIGVLETLMGVVGSQVIPVIYAASVATFASLFFLVGAASMLPASFFLCGLPPFEDVVKEAQEEQKQLCAKLLPITEEEEETATV